MPETQAPYLTEHQASFSATGQVLPGGKFEIFCITAGNANGWDFPADVLESSLALWDGAHCFIDHAWFSRSLRDLAGQISAPLWDEDAQGIRATLKAFGPGGEVLTAFANEILQEETPARVGFSADVLFTANGKKVNQILRVLSLDLVYDPARGGAFSSGPQQQVAAPWRRAMFSRSSTRAQHPKANPINELTQSSGGIKMPEEIEKNQRTPRGTARTSPHQIAARPGSHAPAFRRARTPNQARSGPGRSSKIAHSNVRIFTRERLWPRPPAPAHAGSHQGPIQGPNF